jgi:tRNA pseudouridine38-40 synthase
MRFFVHLAYNGKNYNGWQIQKNSVSTVQQVIQHALHILSREEISIVGCGRTDSGVHAADYFIHFDSDFDWIGQEYKLNRILPLDIVIYNIVKVGSEDHARFDAELRSYTYKMHTYKDVFQEGLSFFYRPREIDLEIMNEAATLFLNFTEFYPFCKSKSGVEHYKCDLISAFWIQLDASHYEFKVSSNRFLRGMIRLMVGACLLVNEKKLNLSEIQLAMEMQERLPKSLSAPPEGLYLSKIIYPEKISAFFK